MSHLQDMRKRMRKKLPKNAFNDMDKTESKQNYRHITLRFITLLHLG